MRVLLAAAALAAVSITGSAQAEGIGVIHGRTVELHREASAPGESLDEFITRISPRALAVSKAARATVCGEVVGDEAFTVQLKTDGYVSDCGLPRTGRTYVLVNGTATDIRENHFPLANRNRPGYLITPWAVKARDGAGIRTVADLTK